MQSTTKLFAACVLVFPLTSFAASPAIGFVQATGDFRLNQTVTRGNGTLFDGSVVETTVVRSDVSLNSGGHIALAPNSRTRIFKQRAILECGAAEISGTGYTLIAAKLSISGFAAQVTVDSPTRIRVGAPSTPVEVRNSGNVLIARVNPGTALEFDSQGEASSAIAVAGMVTKEGDSYFIIDRATNVQYQLLGTGLDKFVGMSAKVTGSLVPNVAAAGGAAGVVAASTAAATGAITAAATGAISTTATTGAAGAAGAAGAGAIGGIGLSTAMIAGIGVATAAAGVVSGLAATGSLTSSSASTP